MANHFPKTLRIGKVLNLGDGFFDSVAQTLQQIKPSETTSITAKSLRKTCKQFAMRALNSSDGNWFQSHVNNASKKGEEVMSIKEYIPRIEFTMRDIEQEAEVVKVLALKDVIRGRPEVEGRIICQEYGVRLHVVRLQTIDEQQTCLHQCVDEFGFGEENPDYNDDDTIHIIENECGDFKPLLRSTFATKMIQFLKRRRKFYPDDLIEAIQSNDIEGTKLQLQFPFRITPLWPFDHPQYHCETPEQFLQQMFSDCRIARPLSSEMQLYLREEFQFSALSFNISQLAKEYATPEDVLDTVCASLKRFSKYADAILHEKGLSHHHLNMLYFSLVAEKYEKLLKMCHNVTRRVFKEIEVPLTKLLFPLIEFSRFWSTVNRLRVLKINLIGSATETFQDWSEFQQQLDRVEEMKSFFGDYRFGHVQFHLVDQLIRAFLKLREEIHRPGKKNPGASEPHTYELYSVMKDIATLDRILKYVDAALFVNLNENSGDINDASISKLVFERALQVCGEYLKNEDETPHLSEKGQSKLLKAGVPIATISHLRNLLSHCSTMMAFNRHSDDIDVATLKNVQNDLKQIKRVIFKVLRQQEFLQVKILMKDIPLHQYSDSDSQCEGADEYVNQIEMCTTREMLKNIIENICSLSERQSNSKSREIDRTVHEILFMLNIKDIANDIRLRDDAVLGKPKRNSALHQLTNIQNYAFFDQSDVASSITAILNTKGIAAFYAAKLNGDKCQTSAVRLNLGEIFIKDLVDNALPKLKTSLNSNLTSNDLAKSKTDCIYTNVLRTLTENPELTEAGMNLLLNELIDGSISEEELFKLWHLPDSDFPAFQNILQGYLQRMKCHLRSKQILDDIFQNVTAAARELLPPEEFERVDLEMKNKMVLHLAKTKLVNLCSGIRKVSEAEFYELVSKFQSKDHEKIWGKSYSNRQKCKNQVDRLKDPYGNLLKVISKENGFHETLDNFRNFTKTLDVASDCAQFLDEMFAHEVEKQFENHFHKNIELLRQLDLHRKGTSHEDQQQKFNDQKQLLIAAEMLVLRTLTTLKEICAPKVFPKIEKLIQMSIVHSTDEKCEATMGSLRNYLAHGDALGDIRNTKVKESVLLAAEILAQNGLAILAIKTMITDDDSAKLLETCLSSKSDTDLSSLLTNKYKSHIELIKQSDYWKNDAWKADLMKLVAAQEPDNGPDLCERNTVEMVFRALDEEFVNAVCFNDLKMTQFSLDRGILARVGSIAVWAMHFAAENNCLQVMVFLLKRGFLINSVCAGNYTPLHIAVSNRHAEVVRFLLERNADIDAENIDGFTPLHIAAMIGNHDIAKILIEHGANLRGCNKTKMTPLHLAAWNGHQDVVATLLENGAVADAPDQSFRTPLFLATQKGHDRIVSVLLANGASANGNGILNLPPLCIAVWKNGCIDLVKLLIDHGADVNAVDFKKETPLHRACHFNRAEAMACLLQNGADVAARNEATFTPLHLVAILGNDNFAVQLLEAGADVEGVDKKGWTALHFAALKNNASMAGLLLERGAMVNRAGNHKVTAFHVALAQKHKEMCEFLLRHGADVHVPYYAQDTESELGEEKAVHPLKLAVLNRDARLVAMLLAAGVDSQVVEEGHNTALHWAADVGAEDVAQLLLDAKAEVNATDAISCTPLHRAVIAGHFNIAQLLLRRGADVNATNETKLAALHFAAKSGFCEIIKLLIDHGADIHVRNEDDLTAMAFAVMYGQPNSIETLLELGFQIDAKIRYNRTALHVACDVMGYHNNQTRDDEKCPDRNTMLRMVRMLIRHEADVDARDVLGRTPLHLAANAGETEVVKVLLEHGANVDAMDFEKDTPLRLARRGGHVECCECLIANGASMHGADSELDHLVIASAENKSVVVPPTSQPGNLLQDEGKEKLREAVQEGNLFLVKKLLSGIPFSNDIDHNFLHVSVTNADTEIVELLLKHGADINHVNPDSGFTPLHLAVNIGYSEVTGFLMDKGADVRCLTKDKKQTPLHVAIENDRTDMVKLLLDKDATLVNGAEDSTDPPLTLACRTANLDLVNLLLERGALINGTKSGHDAPIHVAISKNHLPLIDALLHRGADIRAIGKDGNTSLHYCTQHGDIGLAQRLIDLGAEVNSTNEEHQTPLHIAAQNGHHKAAEFLIRNGAEVNGASKDVDSPLHLAVRNKRMEVVEVLTENEADLNVRNHRMQTPLHEASFIDCYGTVDFFLKKGAEIEIADQNNFTPLLIALREGHYGIVHLLITSGADVNATTDEKWAGLHQAIRSGDSAIITEVLRAGADVNCLGKDNSTPCHLAVSEGSWENVKTLIEHGANVNIPDKNNRTPLHVACSESFRDIAEHLIASGAEVNIGDDKGDTPLILAIKQVNPDMAQMLMDNGADGNLANRGGFTPLHCAILLLHNIEVLQVLLRNGVDVNAAPANFLHFAGQFGSEFAVKSLIDSGVSVNASMGSEVTPLHLAALKGNLQTARILLDSGAEVNVKNAAKQTPLHDAILMRRTDVARLLLENGANAQVLLPDKSTFLHHASQAGHHEIVETLLAHGLTVDAATTTGQTPLHVAAKHGQDNVARLLLQHGANRNAPDESGSSPLHLASLHGHLNVVQELLEVEEDEDVENTSCPKDIHCSAPVSTNIDAVNNDGLTPLITAILNGHDHIALALTQKGANVNLADDNGDTPLMLAVENRRDVVARCLISKGADVNATNSTSHRPLHQASRMNNVDMFKHLLDNGANLDALLVNGGTVLHHASCMGCSAEIVQLLLDLGVKVDAVNDEGQTPLHLASSAGSAKTVGKLLEKGADPNALDHTGQRPLHYLAFGEILYASDEGQESEREQYLESAKLLISAGADVDAIDRRNLSALYIAVSRNSVGMVRLLLEKGANVNGNVQEMMDAPLHYAVEGAGCADIIQILLSNGAEVDRKNDDESTALFLAAAKGHLEAVEILLQNNACPSARNGHASVLHAAVHSNNSDIMKLILDKLRAEPQFDSFLNAPDSDGDTPLMWAAESGHFNAAQLLLQYGANVAVENKTGLTAMDWTLKNGHYDIVELLSNHSE